MSVKTLKYTVIPCYNVHLAITDGNNAVFKRKISSYNFSFIKFFANFFQPGLWSKYSLGSLEID